MKVGAAGMSSHELTATPSTAQTPHRLIIWPVPMLDDWDAVSASEWCNLIFMWPPRYCRSLTATAIPGLSAACMNYLLNINPNVLFSIQEAFLSLHTILFLSALRLKLHLQSYSMAHSYEPFSLSAYIHYIMYV